MYLDRLVASLTYKVRFTSFIQGSTSSDPGRSHYSDHERGEEQPAPPGFPVQTQEMDRGRQPSPPSNQNPASSYPQVVVLDKVMF